VIRVRTIAEFRDALKQAKVAGVTTAVHIETDPLAPVPSPDSWWDVPVPEVAALESTRNARGVYEAWKARQRPLL
jgi:3D-(3,5/4)-trihydroxycyclohexane-1,2-dione acylhydrolase (decyclizing)